MCAEPIQPGSLVLSLAGHDQGKVFAVLAADAAFVLLADGKTRRVEKPKKKKRRHVEAFPGDLGPVSDAIREGCPVANSTLRRALNAAVARNHCGPIDKEE